MKIRENKTACTMAKVFALTFVVYGMCILISSWLNGGVFQLGTDYFDQQIPFTIYCSQAIRDGNLLWADAVDLGTSFINAFGYYNIGSPFFWIAMLFSPDKIPAVMTFMLVVKFACVAMFTYLYLSRYTKTDFAAACGGLLFAFSSYLINNTVFHFVDSILMFPLLLWALDEEMYKDKRLIFAIVSAVSMLTNYVIFIGEVVFLIIYFAVKLISKEYSLTVKKFVQLSTESLLGVGVASVIVVPSAVALISNPRLGLSFAGLKQMIVFKPIQYAELIKCALFPVDTMARKAFFISGNPTAPDFYLPLFGCILGISYIVHNRKSWVSKILGVSFIFALVPILNSSFMLFNSEYYARWLYMPLLIFTLATVLELENHKASLKYGFLGWAALVALFLGNAIYWKLHFGTDLVEIGNGVAIIQHSGLALVLTVLMLFGVIFCLILRPLQNNFKYSQGVIFIGVMIFSVMTTVYSYNNLHWVSNNNKQIAQDFYHNSAHLGIEDDEYYRIDTLDTYMNLGIVSNTSSVNFFTTTISGSIFDFYNGALETSRTIKSNVPHNNFQLRSLLSCKYYIVSQSEDVPPHAVLISENGNFKIYQNEYFIPMGYCMKNVITQSEYSKIDKEDKPNALLNAIVLSDDDVEKFGISAVNAEEVISGSLDDTIEQNVNFNKNNSCKSFEKVKNGYRAVSDFENERIIFFSIPADKGWTVRVNGKKTSALIADYGLMAVKCQGGNNIIEFAYMPVGLKIGGLMSAVSAMLMAVYFFVSKKHYK